MELAVYNIKGEDTGRKVTLSDAIFGLEVNEHVMYLDVKQYLANQRQGTHKSKQRAEINRTTTKLKKQKGTGGARPGSMKSGAFVGGGRLSRFVLHLLRGGEIAFDLAGPLVDDLFHSRQRDSRHHQVQYAKGNREP